MIFKCIKSLFDFFKSCKICTEECGKREVSPYNFICDDCYKSLMKYKYKSAFSRREELSLTLIKNGKKETHKIGADALFRYEGEARTLLLEYKMEGDEKLKVFFKDAICEYLTSNFDKNNTILIPLPCSKKGFKTRGFDQCIEILKLCTYPYIDAIFLLKKHTKQQKQLGAKDREKISEGKYEIDRKMLEPILYKYQNVVLFDDVLTTGNSLKSVLKELYPFLKERNKGVNISCLTLCREEEDI